MFLLIFTIDGPMLVNRGHIVSAAPSRVNVDHTTLKMSNGDSVEMSTEYRKVVDMIPNEDCL